MDGILPLWKPKGLTSHDCVYKVRKLLRMKKVGHTGTLDPEVDGVLPICLGRATKIAEYITNAGKMYEGEVTLGYSTTTEDATGEVVERKKIDHPIGVSDIEDILNSLTGQINQTPPMYSAVKVKGKRLYEYARAGIEVERPSRTVQIYALELLKRTIVEQAGTIKFRFRVHCSKGTYIRTLAVSIGEKLGYPAHMSQLTRVASADITASDCVTFEQIEMAMKEEKIQQYLIPLEEGISYLPFYEIDDNLAIKIKNGAVLSTPLDWPNEANVVMSHHGKAIAIYDTHPSKEAKIKPIKVLRNNECKH